MIRNEKLKKALFFCFLIVVSLLLNSCDSSNLKGNGYYAYHTEKGTTIQTGSPAKPLDDTVITKLLNNCRKAPWILEAYQYGRGIDGEFSLVLALKLTDYSEDTQRATIHVVRDAIKNVELLDLYFIKENDGMYERIKQIENSQIYKK